MKFGLQSYPETDLTTKATSIKPCQGLTILFYCLMIGINIRSFLFILVQV